MKVVDTQPFVSVHAENRVILRDECPFVYVANLLGTHWRPAILYKIAHGVETYNALRGALEPITDTALAAGLRSLIENDLVRRNELGTSPRRSTYEVTVRGASLLPILTAMEAWSLRDRHAEDGVSALTSVGD